MKAIVVEQPGSPARLVWREVPDPVPGAGDVLIDVAASAVNRADLLQAAGHYPRRRAPRTPWAWSARG